MDIKELAKNTINLTNVTVDDAITIMAALVFVRQFSKTDEERKMLTTLAERFGMAVAGEVVVEHLLKAEKEGKGDVSEA